MNGNLSWIRRLGKVTCVSAPLGRRLALTLHQRPTLRCFPTATTATTRAMATKRPAEGKGKASASPEKKKKKAKAPATPADKFVPSTDLKQVEAPVDGSDSLTVLYWNLGGIKSALKNRSELIARAATNMNPEVICFSEHKVQIPDVPKVEADLLKVFPNYRPIWACATDRKGYSGLVTLIKKDVVEPIKAHSLRNATVAVETPGESLEKYQLLSAHRGLGMPPNQSDYNSEGRVITLNLAKPNIYIVFSYVPNSGDGLKRLRYRIDTWESDCREYLQQLAKEKPVCYVGDLNVAHLDSDIWNAGAKHLEKSAGTTTEERNTFSKLLDCGFVDGFRHFHPEAQGHFSYWSVRARNKPHNRGLRLDYTVVSKSLVDGASASVQLADAFLDKDLCAPHGDHCAVGMTVKY